jgi:predicted transcriptional regulator
MPTEAELRILGVLWARGPSTVRDVHEALVPDASAAYTTTLKFLQIMYEKGLVTRDDSQRSHVYAPAVGEADTKRRAAKDLLGRVFGGSMEALVQSALSAKPASRDELRRIRELVAELEARQEKK